MIGQEARIAVEQAIEKLRALAALIDRGKGGREVALAITKAQEALHWLSEVE